MEGKLILGKHIDFSSKNVRACPLINIGNIKDIYWACEVSSFIIESVDSKKEESNRKYNMIFDTGTNRIILPLDYYLDLKNKIEDSGSKGHKRSGCYEIIYQNENSIQFSLKINGYIYTLPLKLTYTDYTRLKVRYFFYFFWRISYNRLIIFLSFSYFI